MLRKILITDRQNPYLKMDQEVNVQWNNFQGSLAVQLDSMRQADSFCDVTLFCEETELKAHKVILSACSSAFQTMLKNNSCPHPIIFLHNLKCFDVEAILKFIYTGQVNIDTEQLSSFLEAAASLKIRGLEHMLEQAKSVEKGFIDKSKIEDKKLEEPPLKKAKMSDLSPSKSYQPETDESNGVGLKEKFFMMDENDNSMNFEVEELSMVLLKEESFSDAEEKNGGIQQGSEADQVNQISWEREEDGGDFAKTEDVTAPPTNIQEEGFSDVEEPHGKVTQSAADKIKDVSKGVSADCDVDGKEESGMLPKSCANPPKVVVSPGPYSQLTSLTPYICPFCPQAYTKFGFRRRHVKAVHSQSALLPCKWCKIILPSRQQWHDHIISQHSVSQAEAKEGLDILAETDMVTDVNVGVSSVVQNETRNSLRKYRVAK